MKTRLSLLPAFVLLAVGSASATVRYVDANSANPAPPYANWATAARMIQDAADAATPGDEIVVTNGVYATGGRAVGTLFNRVAVDRPLTLRSVNGPQVTIIQGAKASGATVHDRAGNGDGAIRCVYLASGARLSGFTLTNGATRLLGTVYENRDEEACGGGVWCASPDATLTNCILVGNSAADQGGGASGGALEHCTLAGNWAHSGGGAHCSALDNCTLTDNSAYFGGGGAN